MKDKFTQKAPVDNIVSLPSLVMDSECDECAVGTGRRDWPGARCEKVVDWTWTSYTAAGQLLAGVPECATSLTRPVETSLECRSHSSTPNTTPLPCRGKVDSHILMVLVCALAWQETWIFSGSFLYVAFIDKLRNNCSNSLAKWWSGRRAGGEIPAHIPEVIQKPFQCSILQLQKKWFWQYALCMALGL